MSLWLAFCAINVYFVAETVDDYLTNRMYNREKLFKTSKLKLNYNLFFILVYEIFPPSTPYIINIGLFINLILILVSLGVVLFVGHLLFFHIKLCKYPFIYNIMLWIEN